MESILKALDDKGNQINDILKKGGSDWVVKHQKGMAISWELIPALERIEAELAQVDKAEISESEYQQLLEYHIINVFHLDMNQLSNEEKNNFNSYVSGYVDEESEKVV